LFFIVRQIAYDHSNMPAKRQGLLRSFFPIIATVFVVWGVILIVRLSPSVSFSKSNNADTASIISQPKQETVIVIQSGKKLTINRKDGQIQQTTCDLPDGFVTVDRVTNYGISIRSATGGRETLDVSCTAVPSKLVTGIPNSAGTRGAWLGSPKSDGAGVVRISEGNGLEDIILRGKRSQAYKDAEIIGWVDDGHVALSALLGNARHIILVEPSGRVSDLAIVPDEAAGFFVGAGSVWYVTVTPGQGIESGPVGPSDVHRVTLTGEDRVVAHEDADAIESVAVCPAEATGTATFFYQVNNHLIQSGSDGKRTDLGVARALGWSSDGELIAIRDSELVSIDSSGVHDLNIPTDADAVAAWKITRSLDEAKLGK
jgi:hypothetical protein